VLNPAVIALLLVAVTVTVHTAGLALLLRKFMKSLETPPVAAWAITWLLIRVTWWLILIHAIEVSGWAVFYVWSGCLPDAEAAFYFSGVSYTTVGYGDVVLSKPWRMLGPIEGLTGILMCGLSTGVFFALVHRIYVAYADAKTHRH